MVYQFQFAETGTDVQHVIPLFHKWGPRVTMAYEEASSRNATRERLHGNNSKIPVTLPNILRCGDCTCQGERGNGPWSGERKKQLAEKHIKDRHSKKRVQFTTQYV